MHVGEMARVKGIALACGMMAVVLAAAIGFSVLVPECAHASGTKTMWVVATETSDAYGGDESGPTVSTFWYDKNGLLKSYKQVMDSSMWKDTFKCRLAYDKKHHLKSAKGREVTSFGKEKYPSTVKISYRCNGKGNVVSLKKNNTNGSSSRSTFKRNSKGLVVRSVFSDGDWKDTTTYSYGKNGFMKLMKSGGSPEKVKCTSKHGRLDKRCVYDQGCLVQEYQYTYKKITVPKSYAAKVKAQQKDILFGGIF